MNALYKIKPVNEITNVIPFYHILYCALLSDARIEGIDGKSVCTCSWTLAELYEFPQYENGVELVKDAISELVDRNLIGIADNIIYLGTYNKKQFSPYRPIQSNFSEAIETIRREITSAEKSYKLHGGGMWLNTLKTILWNLPKEQVEEPGGLYDIFVYLCNLYVRGTSYTNLTAKEKGVFKNTLIRKYGNVEAFCLIVKVLFDKDSTNKQLPDFWAVLDEICLLKEATVYKGTSDDDDEYF